MAEMVPTAAFPICVFGFANWGWMSRLNASALILVAYRESIDCKDGGLGSRGDVRRVALLSR